MRLQLFLKPQAEPSDIFFRNSRSVFYFALKILAEILLDLFKCRFNIYESLVLVVPCLVEQHLVVRVVEDEHINITAFEWLQEWRVQSEVVLRSYDKVDLLLTFLHI